MRVFFFPHFPYATLDQEVREIDPQCRAFPGNVVPNYNSRWQLCMVWWPRMVWFGLRLAMKSLSLRDRPDAIVTHTHLPLLPLLVFRSVGRRIGLRGPAIMLYGFIYTQRDSAFLSRMRGLYFHWVLSRIDVVVCHSSIEVDEYPKRLNVDSKRFMYLPYSMGFYEKTVPDVVEDCIVAAGRSGRDYRMLVDAVRNLPVPVKIICDSFPIPAEQLPSNVQVLTDCYSHDYIRLIATARIVAVPLQNARISSGQMVLLEAMRFGRAVVVSETPTVKEYIEDGRTGRLVPPNDTDAFRDAIEDLLANSEQCEKLGDNARREFAVSFSKHASLRAVYRRLEDVTRVQSDPIGLAER